MVFAVTFRFHFRTPEDQILEKLQIFKPLTFCLILKVLQNFQHLPGFSKFDPIYETFLLFAI